MRVILDRAIIPGSKPELTLLPENQADRDMLRELEQNYVCSGCGYAADTWEPTHVELRLQPRPAE